MTDQLELDVEAILGIGPRIGENLRGAGVHTVSDLLRWSPQQIHGAVKDQASLRGVQGWCESAALMQIRDVSPAMAAALEEAGLAGPDDLEFRDGAQLREIFASAVADGTLDEAPDADAILEMVKDAMVLSRTGALNGTVLDRDARPVAHASVRLGKQDAATDARGRFRLMRIPLWARSSLYISHPDFRPATFRLGRVRRSLARHSRQFELGAASSPSSPPRVKMEVTGDRLPPFGDAQLRTYQIAPSDFVVRDILAVVERSADGQRTKLVSKLLTWSEGQFRVPYAWFPTDQVTGARPGDCFVVRPDGLEPITMDARRLDRWIGLIRAARKTGPPPDDPDEFGDWLAGIDAAIAGGAFSGGRRT